MSKESADVRRGEGPEPFDRERPDADRIDRLRAVLDETRLRLLQQVLAHDTGALSVEELDYRNTDVAERTIDYHLRQLDEEGVVERMKVDGGRNDLPNTYWAVTPIGVDLLKQLGFYEEVAVLSEADDALERTDRIREIEAYDRRPEPDWY
ncbi:ArsR family transcriptional regulator [Halobacteriales archaeon QS_8_69_26]|nr:MAG: ArsR family transcriptional regulator [Halobacteriales archaeon QS_8_69_26]